jgi:hypothetical protein
MLSPLLWRKLDNEDIAPHRAGARKYQRDRRILGKVVERKRVEDYVHPVTLLKRLVLQIEPLQVSVLPRLPHSPERAQVRHVE